MPKINRQSPIIANHMCDRIGTNINGASVIKVPPWVLKPLGKYYLYFAHHCGRYIRLAYANSLIGPWKIHRAGVLDVTQTPFAKADLTLKTARLEPGFNPLNADSLYAHVASPDVHVDHQSETIRMYYHGLEKNAEQVTRLTTSNDGLNFTGHSRPLGPPYFRVFKNNGWHYAITFGGYLLRSRHMDAPFETGFCLVDASRLISQEQTMRHASVRVTGSKLEIYFTCIGASPEVIHKATVFMTGNWTKWQVSELEQILSPKSEWEGAHLPIHKSRIGCCDTPENGLRDPFIFDDHLFYSGAGEAAIGVVKLR